MSSNINNSNTRNLKVHEFESTNSNSKTVTPFYSKQRTTTQKKDSSPNSKDSKNSYRKRINNSKKIISSFINPLFYEYNSILVSNNYSKNNQEKKFRKNLTKDIISRNKINNNKLNMLRYKDGNSSFQKYKNNKLNKSIEVRRKLDLDSIIISNDLHRKIELYKKKKLFEKKLKDINKQIVLLQKQQSEVNKELSRLNIKEKVLNNKSEDNIIAEEKVSINNNERNKNYLKKLEANYLNRKKINVNFSNRNAFEIKRFGNKLNKNRNLSNSRDKILHKKVIKTISPDEIYKKSKI